MDLAKIRKKAKTAPGETATPAVPAQPAALEAVETAAPEPPPEPPAAATPPEPPARKAAEPEPEPPPKSARREAPKAPEPPAEPVPPPPPAADPARDEEDSAPPAGSGQVEKLLVFAVGPRRYAIPIHDISQIIEDQGVTPVPHAPPFLLGIFSLRGRIVSVLDSALRLGVTEEGEGGAPKIVVLDAGEELVGIRVDAIDQVVEVDLGTLEPPPESFLEQRQEFVEGVFHHRERTVSFLNLPLFLAFETGGTPA